MTVAFIYSHASINALGKTSDKILAGLKAGRSGLHAGSVLLSETNCSIGEISWELPRPEGSLSPYHSRCCRIALQCINQLMPAVESIKSRIPVHRIGVVIGTSASGSETVENSWQSNGDFPFDYHNLHAFGNVAEFIARITGAGGPVYAVSTACSSAANALISSVNLIRQGVCDAVITGGVEAICRTTFEGFNSLQIVDENPCSPFDENRGGVNLGEGASLFLITGENIAQTPHQHPIRVLGTGWSSDGYHMTAPDPEGNGAFSAMTDALENAGISPEQIDYINLHGTGTPMNDLAEAKAVQRLFGNSVRCSSTKGFTGHLLGAAAAAEISICCLALEHQFLPVNLNLKHQDPEIGINLVTGSSNDKPISRVLSNSFAFGGNNTTIILGQGHE